MNTYRLCTGLRFVHRRRATSLVQTVTSVATIVGLTTTILAPALVGLRDRNRQAVCAARIGLLTKAMLVYAEDYDETPPFLGRGHEDCDDGWGEEWPIGSGTTVREWMYLENWLMPDMPDYWLETDQANWPTEARVQNGSLWTYTGSETLYRCPEFARISDPAKTQNVFNYTRTVFGRKLCSGALGDDPNEYGDDGLSPGPIVRTSEVFAPSRLYMMVDEQWDRHVAGNYNDGGSTQISGGWMAADCMFYGVGSDIGRYHGRPVRSAIAKVMADLGVPAARQGHLSYYDGHVGPPQVDPWVGKSFSTGSLLEFASRLNSNPQLMDEWATVFIGQLYPQRGICLTLEDWIQMLLF